MVTGGAGYVGSVVGAHLVAAGHDVVVLDDLSTGHRDAVPDKAVFVEGRVQDAARHLDPSYDAVLHFAASSLVGESVTHPEKYWHNNVGGSLALLDAMREHGIERFVFSSTAAVYGAPEVSPITEDAPCAPTNPYGASKSAVDQLITSYCAAHGLRAVSLRYFNVAGAFGRYGERHATETHLIPLALQVPHGTHGSVAIYGTDYPTSDGTCVRDYIHVADLADAHLLALTATAPGGAAQTAGAGGHLVCNLGTGTGFSVRAVVDAVRTVTGCAVPAHEAPRRAGDPPILVASARRAHDVLGWRPTRTSLEDIVSDAWSFLRHGEVGP
ncbi:UDP-glucose 4-epimerase GalE [Streptomyces sp. SID3343]|uniref:UDP-glucose 4-epimerase GalE n=1 Tax=Streptomyces sp. SID3343 TaxID=2690260 RepID=UPI00136983E3|nr:UDP-glucose 4-epimerase GalE [Streptomyces sp. SID3343]MYW00781.1 UDP-glucose 4-epimerase GalE [Streptomyces sp. SID3343]